MVWRRKFLRSTLFAAFIFSIAVPTSWGVIYYLKSIDFDPDFYDKLLIIVCFAMMVLPDPRFIRSVAIFNHRRLNIVLQLYLNFFYELLLVMTMLWTINHNISSILSIFILPLVLIACFWKRLFRIVEQDPE